MPRPQAVIFDIGNVLIHWQPELFYDAITTPEIRKRMFSTVDLHTMNDQIDRGAPFRQTVYATADQYPEFSDLIRLWHDNWLDIAAPGIALSARLNNALHRKGITTAILSNIGRETYDLALSRYPFLGSFTQVYLSGPLGVIKPDAAIYQAVETGLGLDPGLLLFTDDRLENIAAAQSRGWQTHLFDGPEGFADVLVSHGLLSTDELAEILD